MCECGIHEDEDTIEEQEDTTRAASRPVLTRVEAPTLQCGSLYRISVSDPVRYATLNIEVPEFYSSSTTPHESQAYIATQRLRPTFVKDLRIEY
ncbi:unnamed protein product [Nezara viridula]|uniref:Uncharacterized protein n=1 Tax=Nezara viridula TaxID=85310 RepID=A0A9P0HV45_NEZVI|nr:unnamed protein product [Nezara viridula]